MVRQQPGITGSKDLDVNMVIMPRGLTTLEANLPAGYAQALGQIRFDEDA